MTKNNSIKAVDFIMYIISACLLCSYIIILYHGINPNVCMEYRMYYIENTLKDWPGYGGLDYKIGSTLYFGSKYNENIVRTRGQGWSNIEDYGCWTEGHVADLYLNLVDIGENNLSISLDIAATIADQVEIKINDEDIGLIDSGYTGLSEFVIPHKISENSVMKISFIIDNPKRPCDISDSSDNRLLGVMVKSIKISIS